MAKQDTRTIEFMAFAGKVTDPSHEGNVRRFAKFDGLDAMPLSEGLAAPAESPDGYEMLHYSPLTRNPDGPALAPAVMGEEIDRRGTLTLLAAYIPSVRGNLFCTVREGDADGGPFATTEAAGRDGEIPHVYPETWNVPPVPMVSRNMGTTMPVDPEVPTQPEPEDPEDPPEEVNPDFQAFVYQETDGNGVALPEWKFYLVNTGNALIYHQRINKATADAQKEPLGGTDHTAYFSFTSFIPEPPDPNQYILVPVIDFEANPLPSPMDYATTDQYEAAFKAWVIANGAYAGFAYVPSPAPGTRGIQVVFEGDTTYPEAGETFRRSASIIWFEEPPEAYYDTRSAMWIEWDGDPMIENMGVVAVEDIDLTTFKAFPFQSIWGFSGLYTINSPSVGRALTITWEDRPEITANAQAALDTVKAFMDLIGPARIGDNSLPAPAFPSRPADLTMTTTEIGFLLSEMFFVPKPHVGEARFQQYIDQIAPYFYHLRARRDHGRQKYVIKIENRGNSLIVITDVRFRRPLVGANIDVTDHFDVEFSDGDRVSPGRSTELSISVSDDPPDYFIPSVPYSTRSEYLMAIDEVEMTGAFEGQTFFRRNPGRDQLVASWQEIPASAGDVIVDIRIVEGSQTRVITRKLEFIDTRYSEWPTGQKNRDEGMAGFPEFMDYYFPVPVENVVEYDKTNGFTFTDPFFSGDMSLLEGGFEGFTSGQYTSLFQVTLNDGLYIAPSGLFLENLSLSNDGAIDLSRSRSNVWPATNIGALSVFREPVENYLNNASGAGVIYPNGIYMAFQKQSVSLSTYDFTPFFED